MKVKTKGPVPHKTGQKQKVKKQIKQITSNGKAASSIRKNSPQKTKATKPAKIQKQAKTQHPKAGKRMKQNGKPTSNGNEKNSSEDEELTDSDDENEEELLPAKDKSKAQSKKPSKNEFKLHKKDLESLKDIDPEFYTFLKQNDKKLLEFGLDVDNEDASDSGEEGSDDENARETDGRKDDEEMVHKPSGQLEVASDESDFHDSDDEQDEQQEDETESKEVTLKMLRKWQSGLQGSKVHISTIRKVVQAFGSALASISDGQTGVAVYKVEGTAAFNGIIQLCVLYLQPAIYRFLGQHAKANIALHKFKKWKKIRAPLKNYLVDLSRLVEHVTSSNILRVVLKHLHQVAVMVGSFAQISKPILKRLIVLWSTSEEETVRVLAFLCILKITRNQQSSLLNHVLKAMYLAYVRNSKFVSPNTLTNINFMRRSLVEMFALDLNTTYQHAFLYIRQLAIHLRNAVVLKKKDSFKAVYNWQYINSIRLWADLLGATAHKPQLQPLIYPLVSITTGAIKLIPTAQYFPLRFHCTQALISLHKQSNTFIPVLPFILEVLNSNTFNKKHSIVSMKPMSFACLLRLNKPQMAENGFRDEVVEQVCGLTLEHLAHESCSLAYPDLVVPCVLALKQYLKGCKVANHMRKVKQLLDKIIENSKFVEQERKRISFALTDRNLIQSWETQLRNKGTPLNTYYSNWVKTHEVKRKRQAANTDDINDYDIPTIKRKKGNEQKGGKPKLSDGTGVELFPSDSEDEVEYDDGKDEGEKQKEKKVKKKKLKPKKKVQAEEVEEDVEGEDDGLDIVKDLDLDDW